MTVLANLLGDTNLDGELVNAPDPDSDLYKEDYGKREKKRKEVDTGLVLGTSIREMVVDAKHMLGMKMGSAEAETQLIKNIASLLQNYTDDDTLMGIETSTELVDMYLNRPYLLAATQQMLLEQGAHARLMLQYGEGNDAHDLASYADKVQAIVAQQTLDIDTANLENELTPEHMRALENKLDASYEAMLESLEVTADTPELEASLQSFAQHKIDHLETRKLSALGAMVSAVRGNEGAGL